MLLSSVISRVGSALAGLPDSASAELLQRATLPFAALTIRTPIARRHQNGQWR